MTKKTVTRKSIQRAYQDYLLEEGKSPETVRIFTKHMKITDEEFFKVFGSLNTIEASIWEDYFHQVIKVISKDPDFGEMNGREKHLSVLFTLLEVIKNDRAYILFRSEQGIQNPVPRYITSTRGILSDAEVDWFTPPTFVPEKGMDFAKSSYKTVLWKHCLAMIFFWIKDDSPGAEDTDAFIEKTTRTLFDLGELPALDSMLDLGKFLLHKVGLTKATA